MRAARRRQGVGIAAARTTSLKHRAQTLIALSSHLNCHRNAVESLMSARDTAEKLFFDQAGLDRARAQAIAAEALTGADDGELYLEHRLSEALVFDDGRLKTAS